jgi:putative ABC transport system ATP-binding protein
MVTHDPNAAAYANRFVFLADGHVVDELPNPTPEAVLDRLKQLDTGAPTVPAGAR